MTPTVSSWINSLKAFTHPRVLTMLFYGFSAGIPLLLIFSSLSLWLREAGVSRSAVTYFSWAALGYSFKFVWAPLVDRLPLPILTKRLGRRRGWILFSQMLIVGAISTMAMVDPSLGQTHLTLMALACVVLGFSSATQDIVIDAYRIESADSQFQALMSSTYIAGYRIAMIVSGAGALYLASYFGTTTDQYIYSAWRWSYLIMALSMLVGIVTTLVIPEPENKESNQSELSTNELIRFVGFFCICVFTFVSIFYASAQPSLSLKNTLNNTLHNKHLASFVIELLRLVAATIGVYGVSLGLNNLKLVSKKTMDDTYVAPIKDFFLRYHHRGAWFLLALIGLYRMSDIVLGVISNVFYQDLGFSKNEIASIVKTFGLLMTLAGGFLGGILSIRFGVMRILMLGAILAAVTNLFFIALANAGNHMGLLITVISADNLSAGLASAAFIAFLSALTNIKFTAMQYAIFSSLMTLFPKVFGGYSGSIVDSLGYTSFFFITALIGLPVIWLIWRARHKLDLKLPK